MGVTVQRSFAVIHHEEHEGHESLGASRITRLPDTPTPKQPPSIPPNLEGKGGEGPALGTLDGRVGRLRLIRVIRVQNLALFVQNAIPQGFQRAFHLYHQDRKAQRILAMLSVAHTLFPPEVTTGQ